MQPDLDLKSLDELIAILGGADIGARSAGPCGLLIEHLQAARRYRLGAMHAEYRSSLDQAKASVACIADKNSRAEAKGSLQQLLDSAAPKSKPRPAVA